MNRDLRLFLASSLPAFTADGFIRTIVPLLVLRSTRDPLSLAFVVMAGYLPWLLLSLHFGRLADRVPRVLLMRASSATRVVILIAAYFALQTTEYAVPVLALVAFAVTAGEVLHDIAVFAALPGYAEEASRNRANTILFSSELVLSQFAGGIVGALLLAALGNVSLIVVAALYAFAVALQGRLSAQPSAGAEPGTRADIGEGFRILARDRLLFSGVVFGAWSNLAAGMFLGVLALFAVDPGPMGLDEGAYGLVFGAVAAGGLAWVAVQNRVHVESYTLLLAVSGALSSVALMAPVLTTSLITVCALLFVGGIGLVMRSAALASMRQRSATEQNRGRLEGATSLVNWAGAPVGALVGGALASSVGLRSTFAAAASLQFVGLAFFVLSSLVLTTPRGSGHEPLG